MKTIKILFFLLSVAFVSNAQYKFKVQPKIVSTAISSDTITAISCTVVNAIDVSLSDTSYNRTYHVVFWSKSGKQNSSINAFTSDFVKKKIESGVPQNTAQTAINTIIQLLEFGSRIEKYNASVQLAAIYGYLLLPLNQQE